jgi:hypothetical protein
MHDGGIEGGGRGGGVRGGRGCERGESMEYEIEEGEGSMQRSV